MRCPPGWESYSKSGKLPQDIPRTPGNTYRSKGWAGWGDWLGTGTVAPSLREFRPFAAARACSRGLGLKSQAAWRDHCRDGKRPQDIPSDPNRVYRGKGWTTWGDWLGTGTVSRHLRKYRPFPKARSFARGLSLGSVKDWAAYCKGGRQPADMPADPNSVYRDKGWVSWVDWLGTPRRRKGKSMTA